MPLISIIVPVYKAEAFLDRCVGSILRQSVADFELLLVNDGSPDRSGELCEELARRDPRIRVFHKENGGQATARNLAIDWVMENSDSRWLAFIDSDDWVHREYLRVLLDAAEQWDAKVATCDFICTETFLQDEPLDTVASVCVEAQTAITDYYHRCMSPCCKLYARELFRTLRFQEGKRYEDAFITHVPILEAGSIAILDLRLYYYYENPGSSTRKKWDVRNLDQIEAHETRVRYCREHGYHRAYARELEALVISCFTQASELMQLGKEDKACLIHLKQLRPRLLPLLRQARSHGLIPFTRQYLWIYEIAYPVKPVWVLRNLLESHLGLNFPK